MAEILCSYEEKSIRVKNIIKAYWLMASESIKSVVINEFIISLSQELHQISEKSQYGRRVLLLFSSVTFVNGVLSSYEIYLIYFCVKD